MSVYNIYIASIATYAQLHDHVINFFLLYFEITDLSRFVINPVMLVSLKKLANINFCLT